MTDFSITSIQLSRYDIANGDNISATITIKNTSTNKEVISDLTISTDANRSAVGGTSRISVGKTTASGLNIVAGKSATVTISIAVSTGRYYDQYGTAESIFSAQPTLRTIPVIVNCTAGYTNGEMIGEDASTSAVLLNKRYSPTVSVFSMTRTPDDEGTSLLLTAKLAASDNEASLLQAKLYYKKGGEPGFGVGEATGSITLTSSISSLISGVTNNSSLVTGTFANNSEWCFMLWFGDSYEEDHKYFSVNDASANVHLSGKANGGVRFGGFSTSTDDTPKFECDYPTYLYGNIAQIGGDADNGNVWTPLTPESGVTTPGTYGGGALYIRKIENKVIIKGSVMATPNGSNTIRLAALPNTEEQPKAMWLPKSNVFAMNACEGIANAKIARICVPADGDTNNGYLCLSWVWDLKSGALVTTGPIWIQCSIEYWTD